MNIIGTFQELLDIPYPFEVERLERDEANLAVHIYLKISKDHKPEEGWTTHSNYDRKWEHLKLFEYRCFLHCKIPLYQNKKDKRTKALAVPFASYKKRFTHKYERQVLFLLSINPNFTQVARQLNIAPYQVINIYEDHINPSYNSR